MLCAVGRRLPCRMHVSLHRRSHEIVWSMYMYATGRYRVCVIKGTTIKFCMSGSQTYLVLPTVGYPTCSDKWRPDKWNLTVLSCIAPLPLAVWVRRERFIARLHFSYTMVWGTIDKQYQNNYVISIHPYYMPTFVFPGLEVQKQSEHCIKYI